MTLRIVPTTHEEAQQYVRDHHRHRKIPALRSVFVLAVADDDGMVRGVAQVGRPVSRHLQDGWTLEVNRLATDGARNACSMLYAAAWRAARALGWRRLVTYTLDIEPGASLRAAGWRVVGQVRTKVRGWDSDVRPRVDTSPRQRKLRWEPPCT